MVCKECVYASNEPNTWLFDNSLTTMGVGLPSTTTPYLLHPEKKVVVVYGDGSFMINFQAGLQSFFPLHPKTKKWALKIFIV
jgi:thiamine pyrophosphate-dependent acetolactate synthase large subunit-like protein